MRRTCRSQRKYPSSCAFHRAAAGVASPVPGFATLSVGCSHTERDLISVLQTTVNTTLTEMSIPTSWLGKRCHSRQHMCRTTLPMTLLRLCQAHLFSLSRLVAYGDQSVDM